MLEEHVCILGIIAVLVEAVFGVISVVLNPGREAAFETTIFDEIDRGGWGAGGNWDGSCCSRIVAGAGGTVFVSIDAAAGGRFGGEFCGTSVDGGGVGRAEGRGGGRGGGVGTGEKGAIAAVGRGRSVGYFARGNK